MLKRLSKLLTKFPVKSIASIIIVVVLLVFGVRNIFMATGNDTLVKSSTDVYKDNLMLEEEFGGESIIVLYESEKLLTPEVLANMKGLENTLQTKGSIYSILSPVTLIEEIATKQRDHFQTGIKEVIDGLDTMGTKLIEIGSEMKNKAAVNEKLQLPAQKDLTALNIGEIISPQFTNTDLLNSANFELPQFKSPEFQDFEEQLDKLNKGFPQLIKAQESLGNGTEKLINGYSEFSTQIKELAANLDSLAEQLKQNGEHAEQLKTFSEELNNISVQMEKTLANPNQLSELPKQTIRGLQAIQKKLTGQLTEQRELQNEMKTEQKEIQDEIKNKLQKNLKDQQDEIQTKLKTSISTEQREKEQEMQQFKQEMQNQLNIQATELTKLSAGLTEMGNNLLSISENMATIQMYSDIMTPGIPTKQATLDNIIIHNGELRPMFREVIVDDKHMIMMIRFAGGMTDTEKSEIVSTINDYLHNERLDNVETIVSGKPVLDNAIRSAMQENIQKMMGLALLIMVVVLFVVFKVRWRLMPLLTVIIAVIGTVGLMGWLNIPITMVSMAVFPILIGLGIDYAIQFQNRYTEEMLKEDSNE